MNSRQEYRILFSKRGDLRFTSHRNIVSLLERAARRAGLPMAFSQGFNPRPRMSFPCALETGIESDGEVVFLKMQEEIDEVELAERLSGQLPNEIAIREVSIAGTDTPRKAVAMDYTVELSEGIGAIDLEDARAQGTVERMRAGKAQNIRLSEYLSRISIEGRTLRMTIAMDDSGSLKPREVLESIGVKDPLGLNVRRTHVELC